jgi:heat shock protein HslJ
MSAAIPYRLFVLSLLLLGSLAFSGCGTPVSSVSGQDSIRTLTTSANTYWVLVKWTSADGENQPLHTPAPTLHIGYQGRISGQAGVNDYVGNARVVDEVINWGASFAATRKAGEPELLASEERYLADLQATRRVTVRNDRLVFTGKKPLRLEFARAQP